ncbi:hypothetical protein IT417_03900 [bacterium]|nr:hypothetical protein [bacterium]
MFKWVAGSVLFFIFLSSTTISPSVYAQEEISPTVTTTPLEGTIVPTITATPTSEESFMPLQGEEQPFAMLQSLGKNGLNPEWPVFNISDSELVSVDSSITVDTTGNIHMVWVERNTDILSDVYYSFWNNAEEEKTLSAPINISASPTFGSTTPQIITDSLGKAHIVWEERDASDVDIMYSHCENEDNEITCSTPVNISGPPDRHCGGYSYYWDDWISEAPVINIDEANNLH